MDDVRWMLGTAHSELNRLQMEEEAAIDAAVKNKEIPYEMGQKMREELRSQMRESRAQLDVVWFR